MTRHIAIALLILSAVPITLVALAASQPTTPWNPTVMTLEQHAINNHFGVNR